MELLKMGPAGEVLELAEEHHWSVRVVGHGEIPSEPVFKNGWMFKELGADDTMPAVAVKRAQALYAAGIRPRGFIVAHQTTNLLGAPVKMGPILHKLAVGLAVGVAGLMLAQVVVQVLLTLLSAAVGLIVLVAALVVVDPALIVVLEDGTWLELARWHD